MISDERVFSLLKNIVEKVDRKKYPGSMDLIEKCVLPEEHLVVGMPYGIAQTFLERDREMVMPAEIEEFVVEIMNDEISIGDYQAAEDLGISYYTGRIGNKDYGEAVRYLTLADEHGFETSKEYLGYCYYFGKGCQQDYEKAFNFFVPGALNGRMGSLIMMADMYRKGEYISADPALAFQIYDRCLHMLDAETTSVYGADVAVRMADCSFDGTGTCVDYMNALMFYQKAEQLYYVKTLDRKPVSKADFTRAVERQKEVRIRLEEEIPPTKWAE